MIIFFVLFSVCRSSKMPKELMTLVLERDNLQQKWGLTIQGGADLALTAKIASVKVGGRGGETSLSLTN